MTGKGAQTTGSFEATAKARLRQIRAMAQATTEDLGLSPEAAPAVLLATYGGTPAEALAAVQEASRTLPEAADLEVRVSPIQLRELIETLLREQLQEHFEGLRQILLFGGFGGDLTPAFGSRFAPARSDTDIWATGNDSSVSESTEVDAVAIEVRELVERLVRDPNVSRDALISTLLFMRAGLRSLENQTGKS